MAENEFCFKQFKIQHDRSSLKVGTDSILLGAWAKGGKNSQQILDIGTGSGLLALMLAQRFPNAGIKAIEIDQNSVLQARENVQKSFCKNRISIEHIDFLDFVTQTENQFDIIISNPPYFDNLTGSKEVSRRNARHNYQLKLDDLLAGISQLLSESGTANLIFPFDQQDLVLQTCSKQQLYPIELTNVQTLKTKSPKRFLLALAKKPTKSSLNNQLVIHGNGIKGYSEEFVALTKAFYLFL